MVELKVTLSQVESWFRCGRSWKFGPQTRARSITHLYIGATKKACNIYTETALKGSDFRTLTSDAGNEIREVEVNMQQTCTSLRQKQVHVLPLKLRLFKTCRHPALMCGDRLATHPDRLAKLTGSERPFYIILPPGSFQRCKQSVVPSVHKLLIL